MNIWICSYSNNQINNTLKKGKQKANICIQVKMQIDGTHIYKYRHECKRGT